MKVAGQNPDVTTAFNEQQFEAIYPDGIEYHYWTRSRNAMIRDFLTKNCPKGPILEVGAGRGLCTAYLRKAGFPVDGVEISPVNPIEEAKPWFLSETDALEIPLEIRSKYTTLVLFDLIEHLEDPSAFLRQLLSAFPSVKRVMVTVPAPPELFSNYDEFNGHYRRYDPAQLKQHLEEAGLRTLDIQYRFQSLYPIAKLLLLFGRNRKTEIAAPVGGLSRFIHRMAACYFHLESKIVSGSWKGTSLFAMGVLDTEPLTES